MWQHGPIGIPLTLLATMQIYLYSYDFIPMGKIQACGSAGSRGHIDSCSNMRHYPSHLLQVSRHNPTSFSVHKMCRDHKEAPAVTFGSNSHLPGRSPHLRSLHSQCASITVSTSQYAHHLCSLSHALPSFTRAAACRWQGWTHFLPILWSHQQNALPLQLPASAAQLPAELPVLVAAAEHLLCHPAADRPADSPGTAPHEQHQLVQHLVRVPEILAVLSPLAAAERPPCHLAAPRSQGLLMRHLHAGLVLHVRLGFPWACCVPLGALGALQGTLGLHPLEKRQAAPSPAMTDLPSTASSIQTPF